MLAWRRAEVVVCGVLDLDGSEAIQSERRRDRKVVSRQ